MSNPTCTECGREMEYEDWAYHCECGEGLAESTWVKDNEPDNHRDD